MTQKTSFSYPKNALRSTPAEFGNFQVKLSSLWVVVAFNYVYGDVFTLLGKGAIISFTPESLLGAAILVETPIAMVLLSRVLNHGANRLANIVVGALNAVATLASLLVGLQAGTQALYNLFFAAIEIATTSLIVWYAWTWHHPEQVTDTLSA